MDQNHINEKLNTLTVDEKLRLLGGQGDWHTYSADGKLPTVMMTDGPHGLRKIEAEKLGDIGGSNKSTCFPTASAIASSWNKEVASSMARAIANEALFEGISIVLGCGINIKRSPLCGRNFEYFSEDPYLTGELATSYIDSMQKAGVGTSLKHFAVNSQETRRMTSNSQVDERALREIYLAAFEQVVKNASPTTIMASYNRINGDFACANNHLLTDILRNEWGYQGAVISDWGATIDPVACFRAGLNLEMPDPKGYHTKVLQDAYKNGIITDSEVDKWAGDVLDKIVDIPNRLKDRLNEDDGIYFEKYDKNNQKDILEAHHKLAKNLENECAVLLKNEGALPISKDRQIVVIGELADLMRIQGGGSSHINPTKLTSAIDALIAAGYQVTYLQGYFNSSGKKIGKADKKLAATTIDTLKSMNLENTTILFFLGLTDSYEGEGYDRKDLNIPLVQTSLLDQVANLVAASKEKTDNIGAANIGAANIAATNIAAITFGGAPMDFSWENKVDAILHMYLGGQAVGESVADLISGAITPSGKLAETIPFSAESTPSFRYFAPDHDDLEYRESIFVGYRFFESFDVPVQYPFGYGLSYTKFDYSDLEISLHNAEEMAGLSAGLHNSSDYSDLQLDVSVKITNSGDVSGKEIVQLYVLPDSSNMIRSKIELRGFEKIFLNPGETKTVHFTLNSRSFSVYDVSRNDFSLIGGKYQIAVGASVKDLRLNEAIEIEGPEYFRNDRELFPDYFTGPTDSHTGWHISREQFAELYNRPKSAFRKMQRGDYNKTCSFHDVTTVSAFGYLIRGVVNLALRIMFFGKSSDDPSWKMIKSGLEEGSLEGLISTSGGVASPKLVDMLVLNANKKYGEAFKRLFRK